MDGLSLQLIGPPIVHVDGRPLVVDTRKATALLAYLAIEGPQRRESLAGLLWPDSDPQRARAAFRRTLSVLNRALASRWLHIDRDVVTLAGDDLHVDVGGFHEALAACRDHGHPPERGCARCVPTLEAAAALHRGDFLQGFSLRDSVVFDEWTSAQAEHLRRELTRVLERLVRVHAGDGHLEAALVHARRHVALDPLQEPAHRRLMLLYAWTDRRADAVRQYRRCVAVLDQELGVQPLEETVALHQAIIEDRAPAPPTATDGDRLPTEPPPREAGDVRVGTGPGVTAQPSGSVGSNDVVVPLVSRDGPMATLVDGVRAIDRTGRLFAVVGEAGVGKTRLLDDALTRVAAAGSRIIAVRCHPGDRRLAYAPLAEALRAVLAMPDADARLGSIPRHLRAEAARLVPDLAGDGSVSELPLNTPGARARFVEGVCRVLGLAVAGSAAGVIAFDDLHHADDATLDVLLYLVSRSDAHPVGLVTAWRDEEMAADHPWCQAVDEAVLAGVGQQVRLQRLSVDGVERLLDASDLDPGPGFAERLHAETEGLPLAVVAYLQELRGREVADGDWPLPAGLAHLFRSRVAALDETARQLLSAAAVIGRSFDLETVMSASGRSETEVVAALEQLVERDTIREVHEPSRSVRFDFSHEKLRSVVFEDTSLARRRLLHRRVAEALRSRLRRPDERVALAGRIAHHEREAGREQEAAAMYALAGEAAMALYANREALDHLERALALGHPEPARLHESVGDLATLEGDYRAALAAYETAAATGGAGRLAVLDHKAGGVHLRAGEPTAAMARFDTALSELDDDTSGLAAQIHADRSLAAAHLDRPDDAREAAERSLTEARGAADERALAQAHNILGVLARRAGALDEALQQLEASVALADRLGDVVVQVATHNNLALALAAVGRPGPATEHAELAVELCARIGDRHREAALHSNLADLLHATGRDDEAMEHLKRSAALFAEVGGHTDPQPEIWRLTDW